ncbi:MAG: hypothetical protein ACRD11_11915, partial [Terriglobia bacterium]
VVHILQPVPLKRAQIIGIAKFFAQSVKDFPVTFGSGGARLKLEVAPVVVLSRIVVEERVVDVEHKNDWEERAHCVASFAFGRLRFALCLSGPIINLAVFDALELQQYRSPFPTDERTQGK